jgi:hypothetical protein
MDIESEQRKEMAHDLKFVRLGGTHQWDDAAVASRQLVGQERPLLAINRLAAFNNQIINEIRQNEPAIKIRPANDEASEETAEIFQGIIRNIENVSNAKVAYNTAASNMVDAGLGYFRILSQYVSDDNWQQELVIKRVPDIFKVYFDPNSTEPDGSDARRAAIVEEIERDVFEELYPEESNGFSAAGIEESDWINKKTVRVCEYFEAKDTPAELCQLSDGRVLWKSELQEGDQVVSSRKSKRTTICWYKIGADSILDRTELPIKYIPIVPMQGNEVWTDSKRTLSGLTRGGKSPQQLYNFWASAEAENLALVPLAPFIGDPESFQGYEELWAGANKKPLAYLPYNSISSTTGQQLPRPERQPFAGAPQGLIAAKQSAIDDIKSSLGIYDAALGQNPNDQSGKAVLSLQRQASQGTYHYSANAALSKQQAGRILIDWIPSIYDTAQVMRIIGEDDYVDHVQVSPENPQSVTEQQDPMTGKIKKIYNLQVGKYDVYADIGASYATKRQESAESMMSLVQSYPQMMQIAGDLIVKNLDWTGAEAIAERLQKMLPPQLQPPAEDQQPPDPQLQQAGQQMQQMSEQMQHMSQEIMRLQDETQFKDRELKIKEYDAETKRIVALMPDKATEPMGATELELEKHASDMMDAEIQRGLAVQNAIHQQTIDHAKLAQPQQPQQPQESAQQEQAEPTQEPAAQENAEQPIQARETGGRY